MKIISKYKDFYDYLYSDYDDSVAYVRKEKAVLCTFGEFINKESHQSIGRGFTKSYTCRNYVSSIDLVGYTFGIYPYVYTVPALAWSDSLFSPTYVKMLSKEEVDEMLKFAKEGKGSKYVVSLFANFMKQQYSISEKNLSCLKANFEFEKHSLLKRYVENYSWKAENHKIFRMLNSPVFVFNYPELIGESYSYLERIYSSKVDESNFGAIRLIKGCKVVERATAFTDICFTKLTANILKYWFDELNNVNTYGYIEDFLLSSKIEPAAPLSDKQKILSHGFDLKTSFRNM